MPSADRWRAARRAAAALAIAPALAHAQPASPRVPGSDTPPGGNPAAATATTPVPGASTAPAEGDGLVPIGTGGAREARRTRIEPGIRASVLASDNIDLAPKPRDASGTLIEVVPYVQATFDSPAAVGSGYYGLRLQDRRGGALQESDLRHDLRAWADARLAPELARVFVQANVYDVVVSPFAASSFDPGAQRTNRTQYRDFLVAPYLYGRFDGEGSWLLRYGARSIDPGEGFSRSTGQTLLGEVRSDLVRRRFGWSVRADAYAVDYDNGTDYAGADADLLGWWSPATSLRLGAGVAYSRNDLLVDERGRNDGWGPSAAIEWSPDPRTWFGARWSDRYYGRSTEARGSWRIATTTFGLAWFSGLTDGNRSGRLGLNPASLFAASTRTGAPTSPTGNQVAQELADRNLLAGASPTLGSGLVASPLVFVDELVASIGWIGRRNAALATLFVNDRRTAVAFGGGPVENLEQRGGSLQLSHRLTARSALNAIGRRTVSDSLVDGSTATLDTLWLTWEHRLSPRLLATAGGRVQRQRGDGLTVTYDEAALFGTVDYRF